MFDNLSKLLVLFLIICHLTSCSSNPSGISKQELSVGEEMLNATPSKPENLNTVTCLDCRIEIEDPHMTAFFKKLKPIEIDIRSIYEGEGEKYYGFKYDLGKNHQAVVFGRDFYEGGIDFYLIVWDNRKRQFISEPQMLAGVRADGGRFEYIESTITDLNGDAIPDLVTNNYIVYKDVDPSELKNDYLEVYTFEDGGFKETRGTAEQLKRYKTKSFSLPERIAKDEIEDLPIDELEELCSDDSYDQIECLVQVYDELERRLLFKQAQQLQTENKKSHKDIQDKWLDYKEKEFKFIERIFDQDGTMYPKLKVKYKTQIVRNRILEVETQDDSKEMGALKGQLADAKTDYHTSYTNVMERFKVLEYFESHFLSAHSAWLEYEKQAILPLNGETESAALNRHLVLLNNRAEYLTTLSDYLSTME